MSEYQYYEFQAVDRPRTADEMEALNQTHDRKPALIKRLQKAGL